MPTGPKGQKRPADAVGEAIMVARIATGEQKELLLEASGRARSAEAGGAARSEKLGSREKTAFARNSALAKWRIRDDEK